MDAKGKGKAAAGRRRGGHSTSEEEDSDDEHDRKARRSTGALERSAHQSMLNRTCASETSRARAALTVGCPAPHGTTQRGKAASPAKGGSKVDAGRKPVKRTSETSDDDGDDSDDDRGRKGGRGKAREAKRHTFRVRRLAPPLRAIAIPSSCTDVLRWRSDLLLPWRLFFSRRTADNHRPRRRRLRNRRSGGATRARRMRRRRGPAVSCSNVSDCGRTGEAAAGEEQVQEGGPGLSPRVVSLSRFSIKPLEGCIVLRLRDCAPLPYPLLHHTIAT